MSRQLVGASVGFGVGIARHLVSRTPRSDRPVRRPAPTKDLVVTKDEV